MAKQRYVNTKFWIDDYISNLDPIEKLLFLYFLTNPYTDISGVYEIPLKSISTDTGIEKEMVIKILKRFERDVKIKYRDGWIAIKNFIKHQKENPKIDKGIKLSLAKSPQWVIDYIYSMDRLSHSNTNTNTNTNTNDSEPSSQEIPLIIKAFENINPACSKFYGNKTQRGACQSLIDDYGLDRILVIIEKTLPKTNGMEFFPTITTPVQLRDKFVQLESAIRKHQSKGQKLKDSVAF